MSLYYCYSLYIILRNSYIFYSLGWTKIRWFNNYNLLIRSLMGGQRPIFQLLRSWHISFASPALIHRVMHFSFRVLVGIWPFFSTSPIWYECYALCGWGIMFRSSQLRIIAVMICIYRYLLYLITLISILMRSPSSFLSE